MALSAHILATSATVYGAIGAFGRRSEPINVWDLRVYEKVI